MNRDRIVNALLPREYRAQVLGDLQERGFLLRDIVSTLPCVWWTYTVREFSGPIPSLARACESSIAARTQKLSLYGRVITSIVFGGVVTSDKYVGQGSYWPAAGAAIAYFAVLTSAERRKSLISVLPENRAQILTRYLEELDRQINHCKVRAASILLYVLLQVTFGAPFPRIPGAILMSGLFLILVVDRVRITRLRQEFRSLTNPTPAS
jgi:hypothetical protein